MFEKLAQYNFWEGEKIEAGFSRQVYIDRLSPFLGNSLVKIVVGQRRTGKSYVLRMLMRNLIEEQHVPPQNIFYVNMDIQALRFIRDSQMLMEALGEYRKQLSPSGKVYVFLDEVQEIEGWENAVNSLSQDYKTPYEVFVTGSNAHLLSTELSTYLSGRYVTLEVYPFSYAEYLAFFGEARGASSFAAYLRLGGLPELYRLEGEEIRRNYLSSLRDSIVLRDIVQRHQVRDAALLNRLIDFVTDSQGALVSVNKMAGTLTAEGVKTNVETLGAYLGYLCESYFIHEVQRYDIKGRRLLAGERKYYLNDLAFKSQLMSGANPSAGRMLENIVYLHYRREGYRIHTGRVGQGEIDFVLQKGDEVRYAQVCYLLGNDRVTEREFGNLERTGDNYPKTVISLDEISLGNVRGISHVRAWEL
jgi:predicted AAA+ superfamily ATPase